MQSDKKVTFMVSHGQSYVFNPHSIKTYFFIAEIFMQIDVFAKCALNIQGGFNGNYLLIKLTVTYAIISLNNLKYFCVAGNRHNPLRSIQRAKLIHYRNRLSIYVKSITFADSTAVKKSLFGVKKKY